MHTSDSQEKDYIHTHFINPSYSLNGYLMRGKSLNADHDQYTYSISYHLNIIIIIIIYMSRGLKFDIWTDR